MAQPEDLEFIHLLYIGILAMLVLAIAVVIFVVVHQRNAHALQSQLRLQELAYQASMVQAMVGSQESERERIARDLHDEIGASLSAARLFVNQIQYEVRDPHLADMSQQASQILGDTLQNVRHIVQNLSPALLEKFGFCRAVAVQAERLAATGLHVELAVDETVERLPATAQLALYRIVQELLTNSSKHAQARSLVLHLRAEAGTLTLTATDDGCGFTPNLTSTAAAPGMGLAGMQARAQLLGGQMAVTSAPGRGTSVTLFVPCQE
jgi:two-component system NarL family sensor kinase